MSLTPVWQYFHVMVWPTHETVRYAQASTPPSSWYLSPEVFELEKLAIFHRNWLVSLTPVSSIMQRHVHALRGMHVENYNF